MEKRSKSEFFDVGGDGSDLWTREIFKYSEHIHRDRHIFVGRAMFCTDYMDDMSEIPSDVQDSSFPSLKQVKLSLDVLHDKPKYRFSESLNTYVDTRKRIKIVNSVDDYERRVNTLTLPSIAQKNLLGVLKTTPLRRPRKCAAAGSIQNDSNELTPFKGEETFWNSSSFKTGSETDRPHVISRMPIRYRCAVKPFPIWRQQTDSLLVNRRNYKLRFSNG